MKIEGPRQVDSARYARPLRPAGGGPTFAPEMPHETRAPVPTSGASSLTTVDALIALQEVPDAVAGRAKAVRRGRDMLDLLEDLRDGLLMGGISRSTLTRLLQLVNAEREEFSDPGLASVLDDVELRARVELAKYQFAQDNPLPAAS
jgi:hypothetical protein